MLVLSSLKKLLVLFQYPRFPPTLQGGDNVGTLKVRMSPDLVGCQIYYPIKKKFGRNSGDGEQQKDYVHEPYFREKAVKGMSNYTRTTEGLLDFLSAQKSPYPYGTDIDGSESSYPIILFSHGIAGCMEMYSQLCSNIASHGYIVFALEHEDGSGCYAGTVDGKSIYYKQPDDTPYSREKVLQFRGPMLTQRTQEVERMMKYILDETASSKKEDDNSNNNNNEENNVILLKNILAAAKIEDGFSLVGHSFGAATMTLVAQRKSFPINSVSMLDPWCFSLTDSNLNEGITNIPLLTILSDAWTRSKELPQVITLLENSSCNNNCWWIPGTVHQSFADSANWFPSFLAHRMYMRGPSEPRHVTMSTVASMCVSHIQQKKWTADPTKEDLVQQYDIAHTKAESATPVLKE